MIAQALERPSDAVVRSAFVEWLETGVKRGIIDHLVPADNFVQIVDVVKKFGETVAVRNVSLSVRKGELSDACLMG